MNKLILVRHSQSEPQPGVGAENWRLSDAGRKRCGPLAERLASFRSLRLFSSKEPKAVETATLVGERLEIPFESLKKLHEQERRHVPFLTPEQYVQTVKSVFERPDEMVFGAETAIQARTRFQSAIREVLSTPFEGATVVVAHGTVISLFVAERAGLDVFTLWRQLDMPSFVVLSLPELQILEVVGGW